MAENINATANIPAQQTEAPATTPAQKSDNTVSPAYILGQLEKIQSELFTLDIYIESIGMMQSTGEPEMVLLEAKLEAITDMFNRREETISKLISFYERIYDDMVHANKQ